MVFKKPSVKKKKPILEDKYSNIRCQVWKNKSSRGVPFILYKFFVYRRPLSRTQTLTIGQVELNSLKHLLDLLPEIKIKENEKKTDILEKEKK